ncbi:NAD-dependent epimerase/dehydratase family protein [Candidatus Riflebacteria bacterium]
MLNSSRQNSNPIKDIVLIIGGAGYLGSTLVDLLLSKDYFVRVLDKLLYENIFSMASFLENPNFEFIKGDFCIKEELLPALKGVNHVVHLAALVGDPICKKYPELAQKINLNGAKELIKTISDFSPKRFIFTSTCSNYGLRQENEPAGEDSELNPKSLYAETKVAFEEFLLGQKKVLPFSPTILRLSTAFGISRRMRFDLTVSEFARDLACGKELLVYDENTWRPYCHIRDISNAIYKILTSPREKISGEVFNVGSDRGNHTKKMLVEIICKKIPGSKVQYKKGGMDPRNYRVSFAKIEKQLGFSCQHMVPYAIEKIIQAVGLGLFKDVDADKNRYGNYEISE